MFRNGWMILQRTYFTTNGWYYNGYISHRTDDTTTDIFHNGRIILPAQLTLLTVCLTLRFGGGSLAVVVVSCAGHRWVGINFILHGQPSAHPATGKDNIGIYDFAATRVHDGWAHGKCAVGGDCPRHGRVPSKKTSLGENFSTVWASSVRNVSTVRASSVGNISTVRTSSGWNVSTVRASLGKNVTTVRTSLGRNVCTVRTSLVRKYQYRTSAAS